MFRLFDSPLYELFIFLIDGGRRRISNMLQSRHIKNFNPCCSTPMINTLIIFWYTVNIVAISVFGALSIGSGLVAAVSLCMKWGRFCRPASF